MGGTNFRRRMNRISDRAQELGGRCETCGGLHWREFMRRGGFPWCDPTNPTQRCTAPPDPNRPYFRELCDCDKPGNIGAHWRRALSGFDELRELTTPTTPTTPGRPGVDDHG